MINVSAEFLSTIEERTDFKCYAEITLGDGEMLTFGPGQDHDFTIGNNSFTDGAEAEGFPLGVAICRTISMEIMNDDDTLTDVDFFAARVRFYLTLDLLTTTEKVELGTFTVNSPATYGDTVIIEALDDMWKADTAFESQLALPASLSALYVDICEHVGIPIHTAVFRNSDFILDSLPEGYTFREMLGFIAMIAGGNARISRTGYMEILEYDFSQLSDENAEIFTPDGWIPSGLRTDTNNITITGVQTTVSVEDETGNTVEQTHLNGANGYIITVDNPLIAADPIGGLALIGAPLLGATFKKFEGEHIAYPLAEFMDPIKIIDRRNRVGYSFITDVNFVFSGLTTLSNSSESNLRNESSYSSPAATAIIEAKKLVNQEKKARETQIENINQALGNSRGLYSTQQTLEDGSIVRFAHDKPTLSESQTVIKFTADAIGFSTDGGESYPYAFAVTGEAVLSILAAEGINADWIRAGELRADLVFAGELRGASGTFTELVAGLVDSQRLRLGLDGDDPVLQIYDADNVLQLSLTKTGIQLANGVNMTAYKVGTKTGMGFFIG